MRIFVTAGTGHHGALMLAALRERGIEYRVVRQWPELNVEDWPSGRRATRRWYGWQRRLMWAAWRRLPGIGEQHWPRAVDAALFDRAAARELGPCDAMIGWAQLSLRCLGRARARGVPTLLEHPMTHIDAWRRFVGVEYARWGGGRRAFYSDFPLPLVWRMRAEYESARHITVLSSFARRTFLDAGVAADKLLTVPLGVDSDALTPGPRRDGALRVLYVGRLELLKGVQYLLEAMQGLRGAELRLVGARHAEMEPVLRRFAACAPRLVDAVPPGELAAHYRDADVVVFPSMNDALGLVILEAMACGVPVIASDRSGGPDIIDDGVDGFVVPAGDSAAIRARLEALQADAPLRRRMGEAARAKVLARYTAAHYRARFAEALGRVVRMSPTPTDTNPNGGP